LETPRSLLRERGVSASTELIGSTGGEAPGPTNDEAPKPGYGRGLRSFRGMPEGSTD